MLKQFLILCTLVSFICGLILSFLTNNFIMLGIAFLINFVALTIGYISSKLIFNTSDEVPVEDCYNYHNAHSF